ncbi:MAG: hypothetical protein ACRD5B_00645 [Nitrososphaeraceae archaeon]
MLEFAFMNIVKVARNEMTILPTSQNTTGISIKRGFVSLNNNPFGVNLTA